MLVFSQRKQFGDLAEKWCEENRILNCPMDIIAFLQINGLIDEVKAHEFLAKKGETK